MEHPPHHTPPSGHLNGFTGYPITSFISLVHFPAWMLTNDRPDAPQPP